MTHATPRTGRLWLVLSIVILALSACQGAAPRTLDDVPRIAPSVLKEQLDSGEDILVVDTRPLASYQERHIPGAISVPYDQVSSRLDDFPKGEKIVFYCT